MASTDDLIKLMTEFPEPFADPEAEPPIVDVEDDDLTGEEQYQIGLAVSELISANREQIAPIPNDSPHIHDLVAADIAQRKAQGIRTYGTPLQAGNGKDVLKEAYEEALDLACYLKQALIERENQHFEMHPGVPETAQIQRIASTLAEPEPFKFDLPADEVIAPSQGCRGGSCDIGDH